MPVLQVAYVIVFRLHTSCLDAALLQNQDIYKVLFTFSEQFCLHFCDLN